MVTLKFAASQQAQSFSPFSAQDGRQVCRPDQTRATRRPAMNFSVTKMQEENKIAQLIFFKTKQIFFLFPKH
jgi:hypothetical protein